MRLTEKRGGQNVIPLRQNGKVKWALNSAGMGDAPTRFLYGDHADKLAEYEDLEEQGKLLKLPCAVGDTVYCIYSRHTKCSPHDEEFEESICRGCESECNSKMEYYINKQRAFSLDWIIAQMVNNHFGKLVFLTREDAETTLKRISQLIKL